MTFMNRLVSIITVAYQSEATIEKTIQSVLAQGYNKLEYLIIDGASKDGTVEIARKYEKAFQEKGVSYRIYSEPDKGIYDAMNKGISLAKGDYIGILNSDDWYETVAVETAMDTIERTDSEIVFGNIRMHRSNGASFVKRAKLKRLQHSRDWNHPTMFVKARLYKENPFLMKGIHDDYGFYLKMVKQGRKITVIDQVLANFKMGGASNAKSLKACKKRIRDRYQWCYRVNGYSRWYYLECLLIEAVKYVLG